jgi:hypothetical protein
MRPGSERHPNERSKRGIEDARRIIGADGISDQALESLGRETLTMADLSTLDAQLHPKKCLCRTIIETPKGRKKFDYDPDSIFSGWEAFCRKA